MRNSYQRRNSNKNVATYGLLTLLDPEAEDEY